MGNVKNTDKREISHMGIVKNNMGEPLGSYARISNHLGDKLGPLFFDTLVCYFQNMSTFYTPNFNKKLFLSNIYVPLLFKVDCTLAWEKESSISTDGLRSC